MFSPLFSIAFTSKFVYSYIIFYILVHTISIDLVCICLLCCFCKLFRIHAIFISDLGRGDINGIRLQHNWGKIEKSKN